nr:M48 family metalloprotease [uncultured Roseococcus sp.]
MVGATKAVFTLEARPPSGDGRFDSGTQFRRNGHNYVGPIAIAQARKELEDVESTASLMRWRAVLPPVVILCASLTAGLSAFVLVTTALLGWLGRRSRDTLVRGFSFVRHILPPTMGAQVVLVAVGFVAVLLFESSALLAGEALSSGGAKVLGLVVVMVGLSLWGAVSAVLQLRRTMGLFTPDPLDILGRPISPEEAPGLWRIVDDLAKRLGALKPDNVVIGLDAGFFVSSGPKLLQPGGGSLGGRTLYLPLPYLALLRQDEVSAIIGHELAHFAGGDTEYSLRFLPIYAGVGRSLEAVALAGLGADGRISPLMRPSLRLGAFAMDRFHLAVRHWSRLREFAADAAGAQVVSNAAAASALVRSSAAAPRIDAALGEAFGRPDAAPPDLVAAIVRDSFEHGLDDPSPHLEEAQPHPTDTHPPTRQRIEALGQKAEPGLLAAAAAPPPRDALSRLGAYFAAPEAICRAATADYLRVARDNASAHRQALEAAVAGVSHEPVVLRENTRPGAIFLFVFGGILLAIALTLLVLGVPGTTATEVRWIAGSALVLGLVFAGAGVPYLLRGRKPFLTLRPDDLSIVGLDRPIAWEHVLHVEMTLGRGGVVARLLLRRDAALPARLPRARRVKVDAGHYSVTLTAVPPRDLKAVGFAELIGRYRQAYEARRLLASVPPKGGSPWSIDETDETRKISPYFGGGPQG